MRLLTLCFATVGCMYAVQGHSASSLSQPSSQAGVSEASGDNVHVVLDRAHHWTLGAGPALSLGMSADNIMYSAGGGYVWDMHPKLSAKFLGEVAVGSGSDAARMFNFTVGPNVYFTERSVNQGRPYATADIGFASARNNAEATNTGLSLGGGVGYEFPPTNNTRVNAIVHASTMTATVGNGTPTIVGARIGVDL